jgi:hypothetical protein
VVAAVGGGGVRDRNRLVCSSVNLLGQRGQDLVALGCVEGGDAGRLLEGRAQLLGERAAHGGAGGGRKHALGGGGALPEDAGARERSHCGRCEGALQWRGKNRDVNDARHRGRRAESLANQADPNV